ncbi:MAG: flippase [Lachnospiraceae bacterium]|nr:flippase [Lachnospiraceae bacterium]
MSGKEVSLKKNFIMNAALGMSAFIFPLVTAPYVLRVLGPEGNGKVSFATSVVSYFALFSQLGIPTYGVRACAEVRDDREALSRCVEELLFINLVMSAVSYAAFFAAVFLVPNFRENKELFFIASWTILFNCIGMEWLFKGLEKYRYITIRSLIFKVIALVVMFAIVRTRDDTAAYAFTTVLAASASGVMNLFYARKYVDLKPIGSLNFRRHMKAVGIFFAMACASTIYTHLDVVMLGFMTTDTDVGYYHAAVRVKQILVSIVISLGTVLLPRASYYVKQGRMEEFWRISGKALNFVMLAASPLALYFILFAKEGIRFLSGNEYGGSVLPMQIIMPTLLFIGLTNIMGIQILVPTGREKIVLHSMIAGSVVDLILNTMLIPHMRSSGAAIGTVAAEFAVLVWQYLFLRKEIHPLVEKIRFGLIAVALAAGSVASILVKRVLPSDSALQCFVILLISAVLFFGVYGGILLAGRESLVTEITGQVLRKIGIGKERR